MSHTDRQMHCQGKNCNDADSEALNESGDKTVLENTKLSTLRCVLSDVTNKMDRMKSQYEKNYENHMTSYMTCKEKYIVQEKYKATRQMASTSFGVSTLPGDISYHTKWQAILTRVL